MPAVFELIREMPFSAIIAQFLASTPSGKAFDEGMRDLMPAAQSTGIKILAVLVLIVLFSNLRRRHIRSRDTSTTVTKAHRIRARRRR